MPLLLSGKEFCRELESVGCLAIKVPLEGGSETRLLRRMRTFGYRTKIITARGLGDPEIFLLKMHGIRPPHLGHKNIGRNGAVGEVQEVVPELGELLRGDKPVVLWILEGQILSSSELINLVDLTNREERLKIVVEIGGARSLQWLAMKSYLTV